jgi:hypothetical protein
MIQIKSGAITNLHFRVVVEGTSSPIAEVRFSVDIGKGMKLSYIGILEGQVASFQIEDFGQFGKSGPKYLFSLEIYIGNQWFVPLSGDLEVVKPISVSADIFKSQDDPNFSVKAEPIPDEEKQDLKVIGKLLENRAIQEKEQVVRKSVKKAKLFYIIKGRR